MNANESNQSDDISVFEVLLSVWAGRKLIAIVTALVVVLGLLYAFTAPREWKARSRVFVEAHAGALSLGRFGNLAGLAGINLPEGSGGKLSPLAYADILKSDQLIGDLLETRFYLRSARDSITFQAYCDEHLRSSPVTAITSLPGKFFSLFKGAKETDQASQNGFTDQYVFLTEAEEKLYENIRGRIETNFDEEKSIFTMNFLIQDPYLAAQVTNYLEIYLQNYVSEFSSQKEQLRVEFIEGQLQEKKIEFESAQSLLARFRDENQVLSTNAAKTEEQKLQSDYNFAFNVYSTLAQSLEEAKISLNENIPVMKKMGMIQVPADEVKPKKLVILIACVILGMFAGVGFHLGRIKLKEFRSGKSQS